MAEAAFYDDIRSNQKELGGLTVCSQLTCSECHFVHSQSLKIVTVQVDSSCQRVNCSCCTAVDELPIRAVLCSPGLCREDFAVDRVPLCCVAAMKIASRQQQQFLRCSPEVFHLQERLDWNFLDHVLAGLGGVRKTRASSIISGAFHIGSQMLRKLLTDQTAN